jgi:hypothetical protein
MGPRALRPPRWLATGLVVGMVALAGTYALTVGTGLNRPSGCGTSTSYFPGGELLILMVFVLGGAAAWWTTRSGGNLKEAALAGLVVGAIAGLLPVLMVSSSVPTPPPGCAQVPTFVRDNYASIAMQTRVSALVETAVIGLLGGLMAGRARRRRTAATGSA